MSQSLFGLQSVCLFYELRCASHVSNLLFIASLLECFQEPKTRLRGAFGGLFESDLCAEIC